MKGEEVWNGFGSLLQSIVEMTPIAQKRISSLFPKAPNVRISNGK